VQVQSSVELQEQTFNKCKVLHYFPKILTGFQSHTDTTCVYEKAYSIETYFDYNSMKDYILPMAFRDLALFHVILFSSICLKTISPRSKEIPRALMHLRECIRLVNETLTSPSPMLLDSTFVVIATLAYFEVRALSSSLSNELTNI
jgi:hypothetical protein